MKEPYFYCNRHTTEANSVNGGKNKNSYSTANNKLWRRGMNCSSFPLDTA